MLKRRIKAQVRSQRRREFAHLELPPVNPRGVPIRVVRGQHVLHPASERDLREVIARLPAGALNGVPEVLLCLGEDHQEGAEGAERDPFRGRAGFELLPGVWCGEVLGIYEHRSSRIQVFAYVAARERLPQPAFSELYLKLRALSTFVHEVAHHQDRSLRVARGRWRMDDVTRVERYAESRQHTWLSEVVIPYLEEAYPEECAALERWLARYTGLELSLWDLAGDPRTTRLDGTSTLRFGLRGALSELVRNLEAGRSRRAARLSFAEDVHYGDSFSQALEVIEGVLQESSQDVSARVLKADVLEHLERYQEAEELLRPILEEQPRHVEALRVLRLVHESRLEWRRLVLVTELEVQLLEGGSRWLPLFFRARAALELARYQLLEESVQELRAVTIGRWRVASEALALLGLLRQRRFAELGQALDEAERSEHWRTHAHGSWRGELVLARYAHTRDLGRPARRPDLWALEQLRGRRYGSWLRELVPQLHV